MHDLGDWKMIFVKLSILVFSIVQPLTVVGQKTFLDSPENIQFIRSVKEFVLYEFGSTGALDGPLFKKAQRMQRVQTQVPKETPFPCNVTGGRSETVPTSVHRLRPGDIDVIGAMGDSVTAGFSILATDARGLLVENRGATFSGGGQGTWREFFTLPNILKEFNPKLFGYATEDAFSHQPASQFNVAENLAMTKDLPYMARNLVQRMKNDPRVDMKNHWKFISIFIGANDLCSDMCWIDPPEEALVLHKNDMMDTLRILRDNLPRTVVSLISMPNIKKFISWTNKSPFCSFMVSSACSCLSRLQYQDKQDQFMQIIARWQALDQEFPTYSEFQRDDFVVISQPFLHNVTLGNEDGIADLRFISPDCFHPAQLCHARVTVAYWRNLLEPSDSKSPLGSFYVPQNLICPTEERPYIATHGNS